MIKETVGTELELEAGFNILHTAHPPVRQLRHLTDYANIYS